MISISILHFTRTINIFLCPLSRLLITAFICRWFVQNILLQYYYKYHKQCWVANMATLIWCRVYVIHLDTQFTDELNSISKRWPWVWCKTHNIQWINTKKRVSCIWPFIPVYMRFKIQEDHNNSSYSSMFSSCFNWQTDCIFDWCWPSNYMSIISLSSASMGWGKIGDEFPNANENISQYWKCTWDIYTMDNA